MGDGTSREPAREALLPHRRGRRARRRRAARAPLLGARVPHHPPDQEREGPARLLAARRREPDARARAPLSRGLHHRGREEEAAARGRRAAREPAISTRATPPSCASSSSTMRGEIEAFLEELEPSRADARGSTGRARAATGRRTRAVRLGGSLLRSSQEVIQRAPNPCFGAAARTCSSSLALAAPIAMPAVAFAQDRAAPRRLERAAAAAPRRPRRRPRRRAPPPAPAPPSAAPDERPPLITPARRRAQRRAPAAPRRAREPRARRARPARARGARAAGHRRDRGPGPRGLQRRLVGTRAPGRRAARLLPHARRAVPELRLGRHGSVFQGKRPAVPLAASARPELPGRRRQPGAAPSTLCGPARRRRSATTRPSRARTCASGSIPEIHISDNLRIVSEIFALDNVVLGSTPDAYAMQPATQQRPRRRPRRQAARRTSRPATTRTRRSASSRRRRARRPPGVNSLQNSINVQRVWGEYMTPVGQLRFGRMPGQWGLGMVENAGDGIDSDYQTTLDRIMFVTGIKSLDLYFGGAWDFVSTGPDERERLQRLRRPAVQHLQPLQRQRVGGVRRAQDEPRAPAPRARARRPGRQRRRLREVSLAGPRRADGRTTTGRCRRRRSRSTSTSDRTTASSRARPGRSRPTCGSRPSGASSASRRRPR